MTGYLKIFSCQMSFVRLILRLFTDIGSKFNVGFVQSCVVLLFIKSIYTSVYKGTVLILGSLPTHEVILTLFEINHRLVIVCPKVIDVI